MGLKIARNAATLMELVVALTLIGVIFLALTSIDQFSRYQSITADRKLFLQGQVSFLLDHMTKTISEAIGNEEINGLETVIRVGAIPFPAGVFDGVVVYYDANGNGQREDEVLGLDEWLGYQYNTTSYRVEYCPECVGFSDCAGCTGGWDIIAKNITSFYIDYPIMSNYLNVAVSACWDPTEVSYLCGTPENPSISMGTSITMPSVSTH